MINDTPLALISSREEDGGYSYKAERKFSLRDNVIFRVPNFRNEKFPLIGYGGSVDLQKDETIYRDLLQSL